MVTRNSWIRFNDTVEVYRNEAEVSFPISENDVLILEGACDIQVNSGGGITNETEAMVYDYVIFHKIPITTELKANDTIIGNKNGKEIKGVLKKSLTGQLTSRIWFNEVAQ